MSFDKLTVSFAIEDRNLDGQKKSAFYSASVSRNAAGEPGAESGGFLGSDVRLVRALLCKHVVACTYEDAIRRFILPKKMAIEEMRMILAQYDAAIVHNLQSDEKHDESNKNGGQS